MVPPHPRLPRPRCRLPIGGLSLLVLLVLATALGALPVATVTGGGLGASRLVSAPAVPSYWLAAADGGVFSFGGLHFYGSMGGKPLASRVVGIAPTADRRGYWEVAADGGIFSFGDARFHGSMGGHPLNRPVVGMAVASNGGYWEVASDGGVFAFGVPFHGSMGGHHLNAPVVAIVATPDGGGYWEVASDGGVFAFGDARFLGSMGSHHLNRPVVAAVSTADGRGYWEVASDGGVFAFGDAHFLGSLGGDQLSRPVVAMTSTGSTANNGYWMSDANGAVSAFGSARYEGSAPQQLKAPIVGLAEAPGTGAVEGSSGYAHGATGYDVSNFQCGDSLPGHTIAVVEVNGWSLSAPNPCLASQAAWAGAGLNLYTFLTYGTSSAAQPGCGTPQCNFGAEAARYAFNTARSHGVDTSVGWWVDVEPSSWSSSTGANAQVVAGALLALRQSGINSPGIYASPGTFGGIVGSYRPAVPVWAAWWTGSGAYNCANVRSHFPGALPTGPVLLTQYADNHFFAGHDFDADYAC